MTISVTLPPDAESKLRELLANGDREAAGRLLSEVMIAVVEPMLQEPEKLSDEEFDRLSDEMAEIASAHRKTPLPESAFTRESYYEGHPRL